MSSKKFTVLTKNDTFSLSRSSYNDHEAYFVIGTPLEGKRSSVRVTSIDTELNYDWLSLLWMDPATSTSFCTWWLKITIFQSNLQIRSCIEINNALFDFLQADRQFSERYFS